MKKVGKVIFYIFLTFFLLIVILILVAALSENKIARIAIDQLVKTTDIPIQVEKIDFSLVHNFPFATLRCNNILVSSPINNDTLAFAGKLYVAVEVKPLFKSRFKIREVEITAAKLFYDVDTAGITNIDFLTDTTQQEIIDTSANAIFLDLKNLRIDNTVCYYRDAKMKASADLNLEQLNLSGSINKDQYNGEAEGKFHLANCSFDSTNIYLMKQASLDFKGKYNSGRLEFDRANIVIDEVAELSLKGLVNIGESISTEMEVKAQKIDLGNLTKYVPETYFQKYRIQIFSGILAGEATVSGMINDSVMPAVNVDFNLTQGDLQYQDYPALRRISMKGSATNGKQKSNSSTSVNIKALSFQTKNSKVSVSGKMENLDNPKYNIRSTLDVDLDEISAFIPDSLLKSVTGRVNANISTNGVIPDSITDAAINSILANTRASLQLSNVDAVVDSTLAVNQINAKVDYQSNQILVNQLRAGVHYKEINVDSVNIDAKITGNPMKYDSLDIQFDRFEAALKGNKIALAGKLKNPLNPDYSVSGQLNLDLYELKDFLPDSLVNSLSGKISAAFTSKAKLNIDSIGNQLKTLLFEHSNFSVDLDEVNVDMPDSMVSIYNLSGRFKYNSDTLWIDQFAGNYLGLQLAMNSVTATNIYTAAIQNQPKELTVHGIFSVDDLDYGRVEKLLQEDSTTVEESASKPMNFTFKINGKIKANSLKYEDALYTNIDSKFLIENTYYVFDSLKMDAFDGHTLTSVKIEMLPENEMNLFFKTDVKKMDVSKLVKSFSRYIDYEDIKSENVRGIISSKMDGEIVLKNYEPVYQSLLLKGDLTIDNGALFNVKPAMEVEKIPGVGLKNMDSLYFSTLNSSIFLFNNKLYIPRTQIRSTSFDAMFLGMYSFGGDYAYHIRMFLGEVLSSKSKANLRKQMQEGGFTEEDENDITKGRTSIYLVSKSENGKEKAGFDKKKDRSNMVAKVNLQKQMVDMRFNPQLIKYETDK